jgi:hypothetical protein
MEKSFHTRQDFPFDHANRLSPSRHGRFQNHSRTEKKPKRKRKDRKFSQLSVVHRHVLVTTTYFNATRV